MKREFAKLISVVFHPVVFVVIAPFLFVYHSTRNIHSGIKWTGFSLIFLLLISLLLLIIRRKDFFLDFDISEREKRPLFYSISLFFAVLYFIIAVYLKSILFSLSLVSLGIVIGLVIFELANMYSKISLHGAVSFAFVLTLGLLYGGQIFSLVCWIPFVTVWSRYVLGKHTKLELLSGSAIGCMITVITFIISRTLQ